MILLLQSILQTALIALNCLLKKGEVRVTNNEINEFLTKQRASRNASYLKN